MERGYVKLYRKTKDSGILRHPKAFALFGWLLLSVTRKPVAVVVSSGVVVRLEPGEIVVSRRLLSEELAQTEKEIRGGIDLLERAEILESRRAGRSRILKLRNFQFYQDLNPATAATRAASGAATRAESGPDEGQIVRVTGFDDAPLPSPQEERRKKREEERTPPPEEASSLAALLAKYLRAADPKAKVPDDLVPWSWEINRLLKLDGRSREEVSGVLRWIFRESDGFWIASIRSASSLRKKFETLAAQRRRDGDKEVRKRAVEADREQEARAKRAAARPRVDLEEVRTRGREEAAIRQGGLSPIGRAALDSILGGVQSNETKEEA